MGISTIGNTRVSVAYYSFYDNIGRTKEFSACSDFDV